MHFIICSIDSGATWRVTQHVATPTIQRNIIIILSVKLTKIIIDNIEACWHHWRVTIKAMAPLRLKHCTNRPTHTSQCLVVLQSFQKITGLLDLKCISIVSIMGFI